MMDCLIAFGSNQGDRERAYEAAVNSLNQHPQVEIVAVSKLHVTAAVGGPGDQSSYLNGAIRLSTNFGWRGPPSVAYPNRERPWSD